MHKLIKKILPKREFSCLTETVKNAEAVHSSRNLFPYTDHGINHSSRVVDNLLDLFPELFERNYEKKLSPTEVFCLITSIHLHDIGVHFYEDDFLKMYCNDRGLEFPGCSNKDSFVRLHHHSLSKYWILDSASINPKSPTIYVGDADLAPYIANICESHGVDFELFDDYTRNGAYNGDTLRLGLLCTLLSLGDALDCDCRRIEYNMLKKNDVLIDSRIHWMKHYYVSRIHVEKGSLTLHYKFPKCDNIRDKAVYENYFHHQTSYWIQKCKETARIRFLLEAGIDFDIDYVVRFDHQKDKLSNIEFELVKPSVISGIDNKIVALNRLKEDLCHPS